jgi:hypothetical protein
MASGVGVAGRRALAKGALVAGEGCQ